MIIVTKHLPIRLIKITPNGKNTEFIATMYILKKSYRRHTKSLSASIALFWKRRILAGSNLICLRCKNAE